MMRLRPEARELRAALQAAPDGKLGRIIGVVDGLLDRGEADQILNPLRPRLRWLRPARPLRFSRLLALPLEGALVAPADWTGGPAEIPRHAILPLAEALHAALGERADAIEMAACGHAVSDMAAVSELGARLWPMAGAALLSPVPPGWREAGLPTEAAPAVIALAGALWRHGAALWAARLACPEGPPEDLLRASLGAVLAEGRPALLAATVMLLEHAASPASVAGVAAALCPPLATRLEQALAAELTRNAAGLDAASTPVISGAARALDGRLEDIVAHVAPAHREPRRRLAAQLRRQAGEVCITRYATAMQDELLGPATVLASGRRATDAEIAALEGAARDLRLLEQAGRRLCEASGFSRTLGQAVPLLLALGRASGGAASVDAARLVEILAGPAAALPLLPALLQRPGG